MNRQMKVYLLKVVEISLRKNPDNSIPAWKSELGVFDSVKKAEATIRDYVGHYGSERVFGFFLYGKTLNDGVRKRKWLRGTTVSICQYRSVRSYLSDGTLWCYSPYDDCAETEFRGRDPATVKLKEGDLAFVWGYNSIAPCIVAATPPTPDDWERLRIRVVKQEGRWHRSYGWDGSDDCYCVYEYDKGHSHPAIWSVFPFFGTISKRNLSRLIKTKEWYEAGCPGE